MQRSTFAMLVACVFAAFVGPAFAFARASDPALSSLAASFVRVVMNGAFVLALARMAPSPRKVRALLVGDGHPLLWAWGLLGALCVATFYASMASLGFGAASVLSSASGVLMTALAPWVLRKRQRPSTWLGAGLGLVGVILLRPGAEFGDALGWVLGIVSAAAAALAYLAIAKLGTRQHPLTIMSYWTGACLVAHLAAFAVVSPHFPAALEGWSWLVLGGLAASASQFLMTFAFQRGEAGWLAVLSYAAPVASFGLDVLFFSARPSAREWVGAVLIVVAGAAVRLLAAPSVVASSPPRKVPPQSLPFRGSHRIRAASNTCNPAHSECK